MELLIDAERSVWRLNGGTILGGRVRTGPGVKFLALAGTLDGVVLEGNAGVRSVNVLHDLEIHGVVEVGLGDGLSGALTFVGSQSVLGGEGRVLLKEGGVNVSGGGLTIGPGITVQCAVAGYTYVRVEGPSGYLVNQGTLVAGLPYTRFLVRAREYLNQGTMVATNGGTFWVEGLSGDPGEMVLGPDSSLRLTGNYTNRQRFEAGTGSTLELLGNWVNEGSIVGTNVTLNLGGAWTNYGVVAGTNLTLTVEGAWTNGGVLRVSQSTVNVGGTWTLPTLGTLVRTGGVVNITGTLDNRNGELLIDEERAGWQLNGGTVLGGRVRTVPGVKFKAIRGTLDGVVLEGEMEVRGTVTVANGLEIHGTVELGVSNQNRFPAAKLNQV